MTEITIISSEAEKLQRIHAGFSACFQESHGTELKGEFPEPIYRPMVGNGLAVLGYRENFIRSALHEIAHWCVAGERRRKMEDYGYWYEPDGRGVDQQAAFYRVEVKPQAIEFAFCLVLDIPFDVSCDNVGNAEVGDQEEFRGRVKCLLKQMSLAGFPPRAQIFLEELGQTSDLRELAEKIKGLE